MDVKFDSKLKGKALLVGTYKSSMERPSCIDQLQELRALAETFGLETSLEPLTISLKKIDAATFIGSGKVEEIALMEGDVVIFDDELSPHQQRNLEKEIKKPVIDRAELILGIFGQRAKSKEARIQIELASLQYQLPRLKRLWTHLSRQRSGGASGGAVKGEGEKQIEIDRRLLKTKIDRLQEELKEVKRVRETQRRARERTGIPTFAIIGYTNAGKSTLLKALTDADLFVEDQLFATLDTTTRKFVLPNRQEILLTDTVGFIRKLPHLLVAAFKSTLEEAALSDILLHVVDASNPACLAQIEATEGVLKDLGADQHPMIMLLNKVDQCSSKAVLHQLRIRYPKTVEISALKKEGFDPLLALMTEEIRRLRKVVRLRIPQSQYAVASEVIRTGRILFQEYEGDEMLIEAEIPRHMEKRVLSYEVSHF
jgi:GTP-binding protein HflX